MSYKPMMVVMFWLKLCNDFTPMKYVFVKVHSYLRRPVYSVFVINSLNGVGEHCNMTYLKQLYIGIILYIVFFKPL